MRRSAAVLPACASAGFRSKQGSEMTDARACAVDPLNEMQPFDACALHRRGRINLIAIPPHVYRKGSIGSISTTGQFRSREDGRAIISTRRTSLSRLHLMLVHPQQQSKVGSAKSSTAYRLCFHNRPIVNFDRRHRLSCLAHCMLATGDGPTMRAVIGRCTSQMRAQTPPDCRSQLCSPRF